MLTIYLRGHAISQDVELLLSAKPLVLFNQVVLIHDVNHLLDLFCLLLVQIIGGREHVRGEELFLLTSHHCMHR